MPDIKRTKTEDPKYEHFWVTSYLIQTLYNTLSCIQHLKMLTHVAKITNS